MKCVVLVVVLASAGATAAVASSGPRVSQTSIAGAKLGLHASVYLHQFGGPVRKDYLRFPQGFTRIVFTKRRVAVVFPPHGPDALEIITWNKADTTAERVATCSSIERLKQAYGSKLKKDGAATVGPRVYAYTVGRLIFQATGRDPKPGPSKHVTSIALYSDSGSAWRSAGKPLNVAGFIAGQAATSTLRCS